MSDIADVIAALAAKNPQARDLARLASIAAQVEPELLRRLRLRILQNADASAEADLWFSELVDSKSPKAMLLRSDVREQLQQELASSAADRDAAIAIIAEMHTGVSEVVRIQEQVDALSLRNDANARADIDKLLQPIVRTLYETDHAGLARWAARAFAQFRTVAQTRPAAWSMMRAAAVQLTSQGKRTQTKVYVSGNYSGLAEHRVALIQVLRRILQQKHSTGWQAVESSIRALPLTLVYVSVSRHSIAVGTEVMDGAARIDVPATEPLLLNVSWEGGSQLVSFAAGQSIEFPADPHGLTATTILGESREIHTAARLDDWAVLVVLDRELRGDGDQLQRWLQSTTGGSVPQEQCFASTEVHAAAALIRDIAAQAKRGAKTSISVLSARPNFLPSLAHSKNRSSQQRAFFVPSLYLWIRHCTGLVRLVASISSLSASRTSSRS